MLRNAPTTNLPHFALFGLQGLRDHLHLQDHGPPAIEEACLRASCDLHSLFWRHAPCSGCRCLRLPVKIRSIPSHGVVAPTCESWTSRRLLPSARRPEKAQDWSLSPPSGPRMKVRKFAPLRKNSGKARTSVHRLGHHILDQCPDRLHARQTFSRVPRQDSTISISTSLSVIFRAFQQ